MFLLLLIDLLLIELLLVGSQLICFRLIRFLLIKFLAAGSQPLLIQPVPHQALISLRVPLTSALESHGIVIFYIKRPESFVLPYGLTNR